jgi:WD40 repeat protein
MQSGKLKYHITLACYYRKKLLIQDEDKPNIRKLAEQPYQETQGEKWEDLEQTLTDLSFIEAKCNAQLIDDLLSDYQNSLINGRMPIEIRGRIEKFKNFIQSQSHVLHKFPQLVFQQAINQPDTSDPCLVAKGNLESGKIRYPWFELKNKPQGSSSVIFTRPTESDYVSSCAISPDGKLIISQIQNNILSVWNSETGTSLMEISGHSSWITWCSFVPSGDQIISASQDSTIKVWSVKTGSLILTLQGPGAIRSCCISKNGDQISAIFANENVLYTWNLKTGEIRNIFRGSFGQPRSITITPNGKWIIIGSDQYPDDNYFLHILDSENGNVLKSIDAHSNTINYCCCSPDGKKVVSVSYTGDIKVWNLKSGTLIMTLLGHLGSVNSCDISPDGKYLLTASSDHALKMWDLDNGNLIKTYSNHSGEVLACSFFPDGKRIMSASGDQTIKVWNTGPFQTAEITEKHINKFIVYGRKIISQTTDHLILVWDSETGDIIDTYPDTALKTGEIKSYFDNNRIITITYLADDENFILEVWDVKDGTKISTIHEDRWPDSCFISPDGFRIITKGRNDDLIKVWDSNSGNIISVIKADHYSDDVFIMPEGERILVSYKKDPFKESIQLQLWDIKKGIMLMTLMPPPGQITSLSVSSDGRRAVANSRSADSIRNTINVWDLNTGLMLDAFKANSIETEWGGSMSYILDKEFVIVECKDKTIKVWDIITCSPILSLKGQGPFAIFPDREKIAAISNGNILQIWSIPDCHLLKEIKEYPHTILSFVISPDNKEVIISYNDNTLILWDIIKLQKLAFFATEAPVFDIVFNISGTIVACDHANNLYILSPKSVNKLSPITIYNNHIHNEETDANFKVKCELCWKWYTPDQKIIDSIKSLRIKLDKSHGQYFIPPIEEWDSQDFRSVCTNCHKPVLFNPYIVEEKGRSSKLINPNTVGLICSKCGGESMTFGGLIVSILFFLSIVIFCIWLWSGSHWWHYIIIPVGGFSSLLLLILLFTIVFKRRKCLTCGRTVFHVQKASQPQVR